MIKGWSRRKVSELCELIVDCVNKTAPIVPYATPYKMIRTSNIKNGRINLDRCRFVDKATYEKWTRRAKVEEGDILLTREAPMGEVGLVNYDDLTFLGQRIMQYRVDYRMMDPRFLFYSFLSPDLQGQFRRHSNGGSTVSHICVPDCFEFEVNTPSLLIQQRIVSVLSALDNKIELNNKINAELEAMAKTLYDYWFVQFDFPCADGKPYKASGGKMVYNEQLKREIPEGWKVSVFNDWVAKTKNGDWGKEEMEGNYTEHVYCVRGADINGLNGKGEVEAPERYILKNNLSKALQPNDFIIEISGGSPVQSTGRIALLTEPSFTRFGSKVICSNFCKAISLKDEIYVFNFLHEWQRLYSASVFFGFEGKTSGIKNFLYDSFMDTYHIVKPVEDVAGKFHSYAQSLENKKQSNLKQNKELASLRDWLLPMLMNGQVTVKDAYEQVEEELGMVAEAEEEYTKTNK